MLRTFRGISPIVDPLAYVDQSAQVIGDVHIGPESSVWMNVVVRGDVNAIRIGARSNVQDGTVVHTTAEWPTVVGDRCVVGHNAHLEGCIVEDDCLIGSRCMVTQGARVGRGSVLAEGAVLNPGIPVIDAQTLVATWISPTNMFGLALFASATVVFLDLVERDVGAVDAQRDPRDPDPLGRPDGQLVDVVAAPGEQVRDARERARLVLELDGDGVVAHQPVTSSTAWRPSSSGISMMSTDAAPAGTIG
jgi:carbonic anhydrase/acetyltransferase-like protein (isoleucine patch superfamily)